VVLRVGRWSSASASMVPVAGPARLARRMGLLPFIGGRHLQGGSRSPTCRPSSSMGAVTAATWGGYGIDASGQRRQGRRAQPRGARHVAQGEWGRKAVQRKEGSHDARTGGLRPVSVCGTSGAAARPTRERRRGRHSGAPGSKPVQPACFDRDFSPKI
jgi:hypothetical protein